MELLLAIKNYIDELMKYGYYPKHKKPSLGKLEKMADLCIDGKFRKLSRYIPKEGDSSIIESLNEKMDKIKEIVKNEKQ